MTPASISPDVLNNILHQNYPEVHELGFERQNLTSIIGSNKNLKGFKLTAQTISQNKELIQSLKSSVGFTTKNLSPVLSNSRAHCASVILELHSNHLVLLELIAPNEFSASNISSMLDGSGANVDESIKALQNGTSTFSKLMELGYEPTNVSSMLIKSEAKVGDAIQHLKADYQDILFIYEINK